MKCGLIKNCCATDLYPADSRITRARVRMKLSAVSGVVKGKRVVMIDDSVYGRHLVALSNFWKKRGIRKYTLPLVVLLTCLSCFYGIDIQCQELVRPIIRSKDSPNHWCRMVWLIFLLMAWLILSASETDAPNGGLCVAYFDSDYPTPLRLWRLS